MTRRQLGWAANAVTFVAFIGAATVHPWWHALTLAVLIFFATILNFAEGRQGHGEALLSERGMPGVIDARRQYILAGPGGTWAITGLSSHRAADGTAKAEITLIPVEEWERLRDERHAG